MVDSKGALRSTQRALVRVDHVEVLTVGANKLLRALGKRDEFAGHEARGLSVRERVFPGELLHVVPTNAQLLGELELNPRAPKVPPPGHVANHEDSHESPPTVMPPPRGGLRR